MATDMDVDRPAAAAAAVAAAGTGPSTSKKTYTLPWVSGQEVVAVARAGADCVEFSTCVAPLL